MINNLNQIIQDAVNKGLLQKVTSSQQLDSSEIAIDGESYINFGSCSYLGLEYHNELKQAVKDTVDKFGTQFSTSRTYLSVGLYEDLECQLRKIFKKPVIASASTTLGHLATLPVIINANDAVILDFQVHSSVQMTAQILKANKIPVSLVPHNNMEALENKIKQLSAKHDKVWYLADGVYSMYGDYAPLGKLEELLNTYESFHLYIDDAHGMGWIGENGCGYVKSQMEHHDKMVLATSLNKSFAASGGVLVFPNQEMYQKVKNCGTTLIFSGPIQPPMLGAGIASAKLHQSEELVKLQNELKDKIAYTNQKLDALELPQYQKTDSPLFFIPIGLPKMILNIIKRMKKRGFYVNSAGYPATPIKKGGVRFMITNNLSNEQIDQMLIALKEEYIQGLFEEGSSPSYVAKQFKLPVFMQEEEALFEHLNADSFFIEEYYSSIDKISKKEWDALFTSDSINSYENLKLQEQSFKNNYLPEDNWDINYHIIRDLKGTVVVASVYSLSIMMDDLMASSVVSEKLKKLREHDPYYLTSKTLLLGTPFTKGSCLFIDYKHDDWTEALKKHLAYLQLISEKNDVSKIIVREFDKATYTKIESYMMDLGFLGFDFPENYILPSLEWTNEDEYLSSLGQKYRYSLRKEILAKQDNFIVDFNSPNSQVEEQRIYELYESVYEKSTDISVFKLPFEFFKNIFTNPYYDIIKVYAKDVPNKMIGVMISLVNNDVYNAQLVGVDYNDNVDSGVYKQLLYLSVKRAKELSCEQVDFGYTTGLEKKKVGAKAEVKKGFIMAFNHDAFMEMELLK